MDKEILDTITEAEFKRLVPILKKIARDRKIREDYHFLLPAFGQEQALLEIAERYDLHEGHIRRIVYSNS